MKKALSLFLAIIMITGIFSGLQTSAAPRNKGWVEAEDLTLVGGVALFTHSKASGGKVVNTLNTADNSNRLRVTDFPVEKAGFYEVIVAYSSGTSGNLIAEMNGTKTKTPYTMTDAGWDMVEGRVSTVVYIKNDGSDVLDLYDVGGQMSWIWIDYLVFVAANDYHYEAEKATLTGSTQIGIYPAASGGQLANNINTADNTNRVRYENLSLAGPGDYRLAICYSTATSGNMIVNVNGVGTQIPYINTNTDWSFVPGILYTTVTLKGDGTDVIDLYDVGGQMSWVWVDYITLKPVVFAAEAESGTMSGTTLQPAGAASGGQTVTNFDNGTLDFAVNIPKAGTYTLDVYYSSGASGFLNTTIAGREFYRWFDVTDPSWTYVRQKISFSLTDLSAGPQTLTLWAGAGNYIWVDFIELYYVVPDTPLDSANYTLTADYINGIAPGTTAAGYSAVIDAAGNTVTGTLATGMKLVSLVDDEFMASTAVIYGDIHADGAVDVRDLVALKKAAANTGTFTDAQMKAADIDHSGEPDSADVVMLRKELLGLTAISQTIDTSAISIELGEIVPGIYIRGIYTDKSAYNPGDTALITVSFNNETAGDMLYIRLTKSGETVLDCAKNISLANGKLANMTFGMPEDDFEGYAVEVYVYNKGALIDYGMSAIDVSSDWNVFPRYAYLAEMNHSTAKTEQILGDLKEYHINGLFYFDVADRHDNPLAGTVSNPSETWKNLAKVTINGTTMKETIDLGHQYGMKSFFYNLMFGAYSDYASKGISETWGMYKDDWATEQDYHPLPAAWETSKLMLFNPANVNWQNYLINSHRNFFSVYNFDGFQVDSLGNRSTVYDFSGNQLNLKNTYDAFLQRISTELDTKIAFNAVGGYGFEETAGKSYNDIHFVEMWPWEQEKFNDIKLLVDNANAYGDGKGIVMPAYMNYRKAGENEFGLVNDGLFNEAGVRYANAAIFAAGGAHLELGDLGMLSREYYPSHYLKTTASLDKATKNYYSFMTAYENKLRGGGLTEVLKNTYVGGVKTSSTGELGNVWSYTKQKGNSDIIQLINLKNATSQTFDFEGNTYTTDWADLYGDQPAPQAMKNVAVKQYTNSAVTKVIASTPDCYEGISRELTFTVGNDIGGRYITFTVPHLEYWTMIEMIK